MASDETLTVTKGTVLIEPVGLVKIVGQNAQKDLIGRLDLQISFRLTEGDKLRLGRVTLEVAMPVFGSGAEAVSQARLGILSDITRFEDAGLKISALPAGFSLLNASVDRSTGLASVEFIYKAMNDQVSVSHGAEFDLVLDSDRTSVLAVEPASTAAQEPNKGIREQALRIKAFENVKFETLTVQEIGAVIASLKQLIKEAKLKDFATLRKAAVFCDSLSQRLTKFHNERTIVFSTNVTEEHAATEYWNNQNRLNQLDRIIKTLEQSRDRLVMQTCEAAITQTNINAPVPPNNRVSFVF